MVVLRSASEIAAVREAGRVVAQTLATVGAAARPGVLPADLDAMAAELVARAGAKPSFVGYHPRWAPVPYPAVLCLSVNQAVVHAIPDRRPLVDGDLLSVDLAVHVDGYHADAAVTVAVGTVDEPGRRLTSTAFEALAAGIAAARPGARLGDIGHAVETVARGAGYGQPDGLGGHGVGTEMHEDPHVANHGRAGRGLPLREGLVIAIEPMLIESGRDAVRTGPDGWSVLTADGSRAAHVEHTIAVTADGPVILTVA